MSFPFNAYLAAALAGFLTTAISLPLWRRWCLKTGFVDDPGHRKIHDEPTPLAGGLAVATGMLLPTILAALYCWLAQHGFPSKSVMSQVSPAYLLGYGLSKRSVQLGAILAGAVGIVVLGLLDDKHELSARAKFGGQLLVACLVAASGARVTLFVQSVWFSYAVTVLWILTVINAFNFMDNMNGLCAGLGAIGAWFFGVIAGVHGQYLVASIAFLGFGALAGFLPSNFPKASVFLGDSGSHLVGYLLAVLAILPHFFSTRHPQPFAVLIPLLVLAVPLADMVWVVLIRWRNRQPFYVGDTNHLSHRLVRRGLTRTQAVVVIWLIAVAGGLLTALL